MYDTWFITRKMAKVCHPYSIKHLVTCTLHEEFWRWYVNHTYRKTAADSIISVINFRCCGVIVRTVNDRYSARTLSGWCSAIYWRHIQEWNIYLSSVPWPFNVDFGDIACFYSFVEQNARMHWLRICFERVNSSKELTVIKGWHTIIFCSFKDCIQ